MSGTSVGDVLAALGRTAPWDKAAGWDPVGLQLGDAATPVERAAVCHEVTEEVMAVVEADPPDLLTAYHPLLFRPTTRVVAGPSAEGRAYRLLRAGVALAVVHTNLDVADGGTADALAEALELGEVRGFGPIYAADAVKLATFVPAAAVDSVAVALAAAGAGTIGNYTHCSFRTTGSGTFFAGEGTEPVVGGAGELNVEPEVRLEMVAPRSSQAAVLEALLAAHPYEEPAFDVYPVQANAGMIGRLGVLPQATRLQDFAATVATRLEAAEVRVAGAAAEVDRVAVIPGSGGDFLAAAASAGAEVVVTGDVSHHRAAELNQRGVAVIDAGHAATERPGVRRLYAAMRQVVPATTDLTHLDPTPWRDRA